MLSPLLAKLYLHPLDVLMEQGGWRMVRYADDFVILCATAAEAREALAQVTAWVEANGLTLHPDKARIGDCRQPSQGSTSWVTGRGRSPNVRDKSLRALKDKVRERTGRSRGDSLERTIADLDRMLRGWFGYFKQARPALTKTCPAHDEGRAMTKAAMTERVGWYHTSRWRE